MSILKVFGADKKCKGTIETGDLIFTESNESIFGYRVSTQEFMGHSIHLQSLPCIGDDFKPTGERYNLWEVRNYNQTWFFKTIEEAQEYIRQRWGDKKGE